MIPHRHTVEPNDDVNIFVPRALADNIISKPYKTPANSLGAWWVKAALGLNKLPNKHAKLIWEVLRCMY